jgi:thioesterase domain-containing protein
MLAAWPAGPFRLAGYCHGGLAAWEIAHQLEEAGRKVEKIVLIDSMSINARAPIRAAARALSAMGRLTSHGTALHDRGMPWLWAVTRRILRKDRAILMRAVHRLSHGSAVGPSLQSSYYKAMSKYLPPPIDSDVVCLLSHEYSARKDFSANVWEGLARSVRSESVPGLHNTCITTHVGELATTMSRLLMV